MIEILQNLSLFAKERRNPKVANIAFNHKIADRDTRDFSKFSPYSRSTVKSSAVCSSFRWYFYAPKGLSFLSPVRYNLRLRNSFYI
jgi:hypothetical protein